jgi:transposase
MRKWRSATSFQPHRRVLTFLFVICVQTIYYHFRRWRLDGRLRRAHDRLREEVRLAQGRDRQLWRYGLEEKPRGFRVLPRRWVEERTFAWLSQVRRLSKDYERLPEVAEAMIYGAMSRIMLRRLAKGAA